MFKVNVDGAVFSAQKEVGIGVIIRDDEGRVEAALSKKLYTLLGAVEVEVKAFEAGFLFAKDIGIQEFILEWDSIIVHRALCDMSTPLASIEPIILVMHALFREFHRVGYSHVHRQSNRPSHLLAKHVKCIVYYTAWIEENLYFLEQALIHDVLPISHH